MREPCMRCSRPADPFKMKPGTEEIPAVPGLLMPTSSVWWICKECTGMLHDMFRSDFPGQKVPMEILSEDDADVIAVMES